MSTDLVEENMDVESEMILRMPESDDDDETVSSNSQKSKKRVSALESDNDEDNTLPPAVVQTVAERKEGDESGSSDSDGKSIFKVSTRPRFSRTITAFNDSDDSDELLTGNIAITKPPPARKKKPLINSDSESNSTGVGKISRTTDSSDGSSTAKLSSGRSKAKKRSSSKNVESMDIQGNFVKQFPYLITCKVHINLVLQKHRVRTATIRTGRHLNRNRQKLLLG